MGPRRTLKDTENYQMVSGLDEDKEAQELTFRGDRVKVSSEISGMDSELATLPTTDQRGIAFLEQILTVLNKIEYHLMLATDTELKDQDV